MSIGTQLGNGLLSFKVLHTEVKGSFYRNFDKVECWFLCGSGFGRKTGVACGEYHVDCAIVI